MTLKVADDFLGGDKGELFDTSVIFGKEAYLIVYFWTIHLEFAKIDIGLRIFFRFSALRILWIIITKNLGALCSVCHEGAFG